MTVRTPPDHDTKEPPEVGRVHDDDHLIGCEFLLLNDDPLQLPLHPLGAASILLCNLLMRLLAVRELSPDLVRVVPSLLSEFFPACFALPNLPTIVGAILFEIS